MVRNYIKIALRNLLKGKFFYGINILGLSIAISAAIIIYLYQDYEKSYDRYHPDYENTYRVTLDLYKDNVMELQDAENYRPLGPYLKENIPEITEYVRVSDSEATFKTEDDREVVEPDLLFVDPTFFDFFEYELLDGSLENALAVSDQMVITRSTALRYFNTIQASGKVLYMSTRNGIVSLRIVAVISDSPSNTHLKFNALISLETQKNWEWGKFLFTSWNGNNDYVYVKINPKADLNEVIDKSNSAFQSVRAEENSDDEKLNFDALADIHLYSKKTYEPEANGDYQSVQAVIIAGVLILILAWVNYINLSTAQSLNRAHEVGVKKVIGSSRLQLIFQFILESFILVVIAAILAITMTQLIYPVLQSFSILEFSINLFEWKVMGFIIGLILISVILSGIYPAIVISGFKPVEVMKSKSGTSKKGAALRKTLVIIQFTLSGILIGLSLLMYNQIRYVISKNMGMDKENIIVINTPSMERDSLFISSMNKFRNELMQSSMISEVSFSAVVPGTGYEELNSSTGIHLVNNEDAGSRITFYHHGADENYIPMMKMDLIAGRNFRNGEPGEKVMIINRRASELLGFEKPEDAIGAKLEFSEESTIVGVIENYHHHSPKIDFEPMLIWYSEYNLFKIPIRYSGAQADAALTRIEEIWNENFPDSTFEYFFLDETFNRQFSDDVRTGLLFGIFTFLSIVIATIGLLGLVAFNTSLKTKEIGIRKILGASVNGLIQWLLFDFIKLVLISIVFAIPIVYLLGNLWLENYAFRIENNILFGITASITLVTISIVSGIIQVAKSANTNPVETLKYE